MMEATDATREEHEEQNSAERGPLSALPVPVVDSSDGGSGAVIATTEGMAVEEHGRVQQHGQQQPSSEQMERPGADAATLSDLAGMDGAADPAFAGMSEEATSPAVRPLVAIKADAASAINETTLNGDLKVQPEMTKLRQLGGGSFSTVFQVELTSHDMAVMCKVRKAGMLPPDHRAALKIQKIERPMAAFDELLYESRVLRELKRVHGVPKVFWQGVFEGNVASVQSLHGTSLLDTLKTHCKETGRRFDLGRLVDIAHPLLGIIEAAHSFAIVHRDLKPANVLLDGDAVCLIDWGLSKKIIHPGGEHIRNEQNKPFVGSTCFASLNKHDGMSSSRRDDIESLVYMLIFLHRVLPWEGMDDEPDHAARLKRSIGSSQLEPFGDMLAYARGLRFEQEADFPRLHDMLTVIGSKNASASGSGFTTLPADKTEDSDECVHSSKRQRT